MSLLESDQTPSTYWITNPNNVFEDNVAAGTCRLTHAAQPMPASCAGVNSPAIPCTPWIRTPACVGHTPWGSLSRNLAQSDIRPADADRR